MRMKKIEGVVEYITRVKTVANQLDRNGGVAYQLHGGEDSKVID